MKIYKPEEIRNVGLFSHAESGKTTLAEAMLYNAKVTSRLGRIDSGTSILDYASDEVEKKFSINLSVAWFEWNGKLINLVDTPGYLGFLGDVISGIRAVDGALFVIDATTDIGFGTEKAYEYVKNQKLPIILFINKMGKENADFEKSLERAKEIFEGTIAPFNYPQGAGENFEGVKNTLNGDNPYFDKVMEAIAETDDELTAKYLDGEPFTEDEIARGISIGIKSGTLIPVFCGDAYNNVGVTELLDALIKFIPPPSSDEFLSSFIFKTFVDPHLGELRYVRVLSGELISGATVLNSTKNTPEKISQLYLLRGKERTEVERLTCGQIGALVKLKNTTTGDTLCSQNNQHKLAPIDFPIIQEKIAVVPKTKKDEARISTGLAKLHEEDPTFSYMYDVETKQTILLGLGEFHLGIILGRLKERFGVEVEIERPKIHYRETITKTVEVQGKYKKQTGGHGQYGDCWIRFEPLERGKGFEFKDAITGGVIPSRFIPSVEKGVREAMEKGPLAGYPTVDFKATVYYGSFHPVDSSDIAFKIAAAMAFRNAMEKAGATILEPIMEVEVVVPDEFMGDVIGDLSSRRGKVQGTETEGRFQKIKALVPEADMYKYSPALNSMTQGRGFFTMKFSHYEEVPKELQQKIIEERKKEKGT